MRILTHFCTPSVEPVDPGWRAVFREPAGRRLLPTELADGRAACARPRAGRRRTARAAGRPVRAALPARGRPSGDASALRRRWVRLLGLGRRAPAQHPARRDRCVDPSRPVGDRTQHAGWPHARPLRRRGARVRADDGHLVAHGHRQHAPHRGPNIR